MPQVKIKHDAIASVEARLLKRLRARGAAPRVELARELSLAPSTIGIYVDRLLEDGFLLEGDKAVVDKGRPATLLTLNPDGGRFVGVDIEARNILAVSVDFSQRPIRKVHRRLRANEPHESVIAKIEEAIREVVAGDHREVLAIGIGVPGTVDADRGLAVHYEYIRGWRDLPLKRHFERAFNAPVHLENNIRSMALAEMWFGLGRDVSSFICLGVRSGIGAGVVVGGELCRGRHNVAGEIGGWPVHTGAFDVADDEGGDETSAAWRRLEDIASTRVVAERLASLEGAGVSTKARMGLETSFARWLAAARRGDVVVTAELARVARALGLVVAQLSLALDPGKIVLAGPLTCFGDAILAPLVETVERFSIPLHSAVPEVVCSELGEYAGALGAAALAVHEWKPAR